jgi:hypothetical protein
MTTMQEALTCVKVPNEEMKLRALVDTCRKQPKLLEAFYQIVKIVFDTGADAESALLMELIKGKEKHH